MSILNHRDYRLAKARLHRLQRTLGSSTSVEQLATNLSDEAAQARRIALELECANIQADIENYEKLQTAESISSADLDVTKIGLLPIIARIRKRLSQKQIAELLGMKEQQVQRYESEHYASISLRRLQEILDQLGVELRAHFDATPASKEQPVPAGTPLTLSTVTIREIRKRGWVSQNDKSEAAIQKYLQNGLSLIAARSPHYRRASIQQENFDYPALLAWQARIVAVAKAVQANLTIRFEFTDMTWLQELVKLSKHADGPLRARNFLASKGIILVIEPHLQSTYLDGAAFLLPDRVPTIGLTLRYDRIDYFWFTLLHEIAHIFLHYNKGLDEGFLDDFDAGGQDSIEREADSFARSALIPDKMWNASPARFSTIIDPILRFAESCDINPAIVVGRIQRERSDFKLFRNWLGQGTVRTLFAQ